MRSAIAAVAILVVTCATGLPQPARAQPDIFTYKGMCDASAAVALDAEHFIVAGDESNRLQIYKRGRPGPVGSVGLSDFLGAKKESDLEGAAMVGNRIYWISSHGRNSKGKFQESRHRFFATDITAGQPPSVTPIGSSPTNWRTRRNWPRKTRTASTSRAWRRRRTASCSSASGIRFGRSVP